MNIAVMKSFFRLVFYFLCPVFLFAQQQTTKKMKVGLVLSGGGSKGFAHIGALKQIEKAGIKLDMIGGTSIGAVVGAMYASGYSVQQIEKILRDKDYDPFINDFVPRQQSSLFSKQHDHFYFYGLGLYKWGIALPRSISKGQNAYDFLKEIFEHVAPIKDFSKLNIPFYCIATNVETGALKVFDKGDLGQAIRASASLPTLFEPIKIDNQLYIDGGVSDNFPVREMKRRGADIIIGVDVQGRLYREDEIKSMVDLLNQVISFSMYKDDAEKKNLSDVYIRPLVADFGTQDFSNVQGLIDMGEVAAKKEFSSLKAIAEKQREVYQTTFSPQKDLKLKKPVYKIGAFENNFIKNYTTNFLLGRLKLKIGDRLTFSEYIYKLSALGSDDNFGLIQYDFIKREKTEDYLLKLNVSQVEYGNKIKFGLMYDPLYKAGILTNLTFKSLLQRNDILSVDFVVGDVPRAGLEYYVDNGFFISYGYKFRYNNFKESKMQRQDDGSIQFLHKNFYEVTNLVYVQKVLDKIFALGLGVEYSYMRILDRYLEGKEQTNLTGNHYLNLLSYLKLDTYNRPFLPQSGIKFDIEFRLQGRIDDPRKYLKIKDKAKQPKNPNKILDDTSFITFNPKFGFAHTESRLTLFSEVSAGLFIGAPDEEIFRYHIGGPYQYNYANYISFYGMPFAVATTPLYLKLLSELRYEIFKKHDLSAWANAISYMPDSLFLRENSVQEIAFDFIRLDFGLSYTYHSPIGPISLYALRNDFFVKIGYTF